MRNLAALLIALALPALAAAQAQPAKDKAPAQVQAQGQSYSGTLADAQCKGSTPTQPCSVDESTTEFGLAMAGGRFVKFDSAGNEKVEQQLGDKGTKGSPNATVKGVLQGDVLQVESIQLR
jgi:hypothetical protein